MTSPAILVISFVLAMVGFGAASFTLGMSVGKERTERLLMVPAAEASVIRLTVGRARAGEVRAVTGGL
jgi:hypothetical protein